MAISDWMPTLIARLGTITGLAANGTQPHRVRGYEDMPATIIEYPTMIVQLVRARHEYSAGGPAIWVHELTAALYVTGQILPEAYARTVPYIKLVRDKMAANVTLGGLSWSGGRVAHWLPLADAPFYEGPGRMSYGMTDSTEKEQFGVLFRMEVKEVETAVTVTA